MKARNSKISLPKKHEIGASAYEMVLLLSMILILSSAITPINHALQKSMLKIIVALDGGGSDGTTINGIRIDFCERYGICNDQKPK